MARYEYKVLPAPAKGEKAKGVKGAEARFALAVETLMNEMADGGWEYFRADTLPSEERQGLTSTTTVWRTLFVFRREVATETPHLKYARKDEPGPMKPEPKATPAPAPDRPAIQPKAAPRQVAKGDRLRRPAPVTSLAEVLRAPNRVLARRTAEP